MERSICACNASISDLFFNASGISSSIVLASLIFLAPIFALNNPTNASALSGSSPNMASKVSAASLNSSAFNISLATAIASDKSPSSSVTFSKSLSIKLFNSEGAFAPIKPSIG